MKKQIGPFTFEETDDEGDDITHTSEVFGWTDKAFKMLIQLIAVHQFKGLTVEGIDTKTEAFADFIKKNPEVMEKCITPNDYLVMGMAFSQAMNAMAELKNRLERARKSGKGIEGLLEEMKHGISDEDSEDVDSDIRKAVNKKLKALGIDEPDIEMEKITASSPDEVAEKIAEKIIEKKSEERKKNEPPKKTIN